MRLHRQAKSVKPNVGVKQRLQQYMRLTSVSRLLLVADLSKQERPSRRNHKKVCRGWRGKEDGRQSYQEAPC